VGGQRMEFNPASTQKPMKPEDFPKGSTTLHLLDFANFMKTPIDTAWLEGETDLEFLAFYNADFGSPLSLRGMKKLAFLRLTGSATPFTDEQMLQWPQLPSLTTLYIQGAFGNQGLRVLCERCPKLEELQLYTLRLEEGALQPLRLLKGLKSFVVDGGALPSSELTSLAAAQKLQWLRLANLSTTGLVLPDLPELISMEVNTSDLRDENLASIASHKKLTRLILPVNRLTDQGLLKLAALTKLTELDLSNNAITGATFDVFGAFKSLASVRIANAQLTDASFAKFPALGSLRVAALDNNPALGDTAAAALARCKALTLLNLNLTGITDVGLQVLCNSLRDLTGIYLDASKVTDAGIPALKRLDALGELSLAQTSITDASVEHLKGIKTLRVLNVSASKVTPEKVAELRKALPQCNVIFQ
jgi:internalin A